MMKQSNLLKWTQNNKTSSKSNKGWVHPPEALQQGHVAYLVKFLGSIEVDQAKGTDIIKEGIRKLKFNQQLLKAQGNKTPKVEVTISIDGVAIQDPKTKQSSHQYPLHRISYCANDKSDKKFVSFIAKEENCDKHRCFVFTSDKLAEDIMLTIGEAFDLAYKRFLNSSGKELQYKKQLMILQKRVQDLEKENTYLKEKISDITSTMQPCLFQFNGSDAKSVSNASYEHSLTSSSLPPIPPRSFNNNAIALQSQELSHLVTLSPANTRLDNLIDDDFDPRGNDEKKNCSSDTTDVFGALPFSPAADPFGMGDFSNMPLNDTDLNDAIGALEKKISEMMDGFSQGIVFGVEDFLHENRDSPSNKAQ